MRPFVEEFGRLRKLVRAVGLNPHRWGIDPHLRKGVLVADLFVAAMVVVGFALVGVGTPLWAFLVLALPVAGFALALLVVVAAQSRDEERIREASRKR